MSAVSELECAFARILLLRYQQDIACLFSTRLYSVALVHLPTFAMHCIALGGPGWLAYNHNSDEIEDFFRAAMSMDMRQAGERVVVVHCPPPFRTYTLLACRVRLKCPTSMLQARIGLPPPPALLPCSQSTSRRPRSHAPTLFL